jgi:hypothetical protein
LWRGSRWCERGEDGESRAEQREQRREETRVGTEREKDVMMILMKREREREKTSETQKHALLKIGNPKTIALPLFLYFPFSYHIP